jgi:hypothetical protein
LKVWSALNPEVNLAWKHADIYKLRKVQDFWQTTETGQEVKVDRVYRKAQSEPKGHKSINCSRQNPAAAGQQRQGEVGVV